MTLLALSPGRLLQGEKRAGVATLALFSYDYELLQPAATRLVGAYCCACRSRATSISLACYDAFRLSSTNQLEEVREKLLVAVVPGVLSVGLGGLDVIRRLISALIRL